MDVWLDECMSNWMDGWLVGWEWRTFHWIFICLQQFVYGLVHVFPTAVPINILDGVNIVRPVLQQRRWFCRLFFCLKDNWTISPTTVGSSVGAGERRTVGQLWLLIVLLVTLLLSLGARNKFERPWLLIPLFSGRNTHTYKYIGNSIKVGLFLHLYVYRQLPLILYVTILK